MKADYSRLDFAYKYPFSQEAREVVAGLNVSSVEEQYLQVGITRLKSAFEQGRVPYEKVKEVSDFKYRQIMGYVYARMLVSAIGDRYSISRFAAAEASTAEEILSLDSVENLLRIADEIGLGVKREKEVFSLPFEKFVAVPKRDDALKLVNQKLDKGIVYVDERQLLKFVACGIEKSIASRLPIDKKDLPRSVVEAAKELKPQEQKITLDVKKGAYAWIEKLLATPIHDVRHRAVNLILAPYLMNVRGLDEESAVKTIVAYIERCKTLNPDTKVNETYIRYQCKYARNKGLRPLSLSRAKDLLQGVAEFG